MLYVLFQVSICTRVRWNPRCCSHRISGAPQTSPRHNHGTFRSSPQQKTHSGHRRQGQAVHWTRAGCVKPAISNLFMMILVKIQFHCESDFFKKVCLENRLFFFRSQSQIMYCMCDSDFVDWLFWSSIMSYSCGCRFWTSVHVYIS